MVGPKVLIGIKTAHVLDYFVDQDTRDWLNDRNMRELSAAARRAAQRETFLKHLPENYDYKFFFGNQLRDTSDPVRRKPHNYKDTTRDLPVPQADEVYLPVLDSYMNVSYKTQYICRYVLDHGYDLLFLIDDDTFVYPMKLWSVESMYSIRNRAYAGAPNGSFHSGNMLFLNRDSMEKLVKQRVTHYADDLWIGSVLRFYGIPRFDIPEFKSDFGLNYTVHSSSVEPNRYAALHSCKPNVMRELYARDFSQDTIDRCPVCDKEIPLGPDVCSAECEAIYGNKLQSGTSNDAGVGQPIREASGELQSSSVREDRSMGERTGVGVYHEVVRTSEDGGSNTVDGGATDDLVGDREPAVTEERQSD